MMPRQNFHSGLVKVKKKVRIKKKKEGYVRREICDFNLLEERSRLLNAPWRSPLLIGPVRLHICARNFREELSEASSTIKMAIFRLLV